MNLVPPPAWSPPVFPPRFGHRGMHRGQPQPRTLRASLRGEERFETVGQDLRLYAGAGIGERKLDRVRVLVRGPDGAARLHDEAPPDGHRIAGVDGEIEDRALEFTAVDQDLRRSGTSHEIQGDTFTEHSPR